MVEVELEVADLGLAAQGAQLGLEFVAIALGREREVGEVAREVLVGLGLGELRSELCGRGPVDVVRCVVGREPEAERAALVAQSLADLGQVVHAVREETLGRLPDGLAVLPAVVRNERLNRDASAGEGFLELAGDAREGVAADVLRGAVEPIVVMREATDAARGLVEHRHLGGLAGVGEEEPTSSR